MSLTLCLALHAHFAALLAFTIKTALPFLRDWALNNLLTLVVVVLFCRRDS
jgi:hypothetical protein